jgi:short-subunit dehydrogenase
MPSKTFVNELGNTIRMEVGLGPGGVRVEAVGPTSTADHIWTRLEARELVELLRRTLQP